MSHPGIITMEQVLACDVPFGSSDYILSRLRAHYLKRLEALNGYVPSTMSLLESLNAADAEKQNSILCDPIVRAAIDTTILHLRFGETPLPDSDLDVVLDAADRNLKLCSNRPPLPEHADLLQAFLSRPHTWIWDNERFAKSRLAEISKNFFNTHQGHYLTPRSPSEYHLQMLECGSRVLTKLLPALSHSVVNHVKLIIIVDPVSPTFNSLTDPRLPGTIILSASTLQTPLQAAEHLLHEALHVKFVDLVHTHSLLTADYMDLTSPKILPEWHAARRGGPPEWTVERALTVMHVYVGLTLFFDAVECEQADIAKWYGPSGDLDPIIQRQQAWQRASFLRQRLRDHTEQLGAAGKLFLCWISDILDSLERAPHTRRSMANKQSF